MEMNVSIPADKRTALKSLLRAQPGFKEWRESQGIDGTAFGLTKHIVDGVNHFGLDVQANMILANANVAGTIAAMGDRLVQSEMESDLVADGRVADAMENTITAIGKGFTVETGTATAVDMAIDSVLNPVKGFLLDSLLNQMQAALRPIAEKAYAPPVTVERIVEREIVVTPTKPGEAPRASRIGESTMSKTFGVSGPKGKLPVGLWNDARAPKADSCYVMDSERMFLLASAAEHGELVWLAGAAGTGKTTLAREYAALTCRGFVRVGFSASTEMIDLIGQKEPTADVNGSTVMEWTDGVFVQAIRRPGTVILLDELTASPPGTQISFQTILDNREVTLPTGEVVSFAFGVVVVIADNTAGYGDESGSYVGTHASNAALVDRAVRTVIVDYLAPALEAEALAKRSGAPFPACERLANLARTIRVDAAQRGGDARPFSVRRLLAFVNATYRDQISIEQAWKITVLSRLPEADREAIHKMIGSEFNAASYKQELAGKTPAAVASLSSDPKQDAARSAFDDGSIQS